MTETMLWIIFAIVTLLAVIAIGIYFYGKKLGLGQRGLDYRTFFIVGVIYVPIGIITGNSVLWVMGLIFVIVGLLNRKKWKKSKPWNKLTQKEKQYKKFVMTVISILVLIGLILFLIGYFTIK